MHLKTKITFQSVFIQKISEIEVNVCVCTFVSLLPHVLCLPVRRTVYFSFINRISIVLIYNNLRLSSQLK